MKSTSFNTSSILKYLTTILIIVIFTTSAAIILSSFENPFGLKAFSVLTSSMRPNIFQGSLIFVLPKDEYKLGDVITYISESGKLGGQEVESITHRISEIKQEDGESIFFTKGDANPAQDITPITKDEIVGRVVFALPLFGHIVEFAKTELGLMVLIVIPGVIIIYEEIKKIMILLKGQKEHTSKINIQN